MAYERYKEHNKTESVCYVNCTSGASRSHPRSPVQGKSSAGGGADERRECPEKPRIHMSETQEAADEALRASQNRKLPAIAESSN